MERIAILGSGMGHEGQARWWQADLSDEASVRKLDASEENLKQAELVLSEIEPRMRSLSRQVMQRPLPVSIAARPIRAPLDFSSAASAVQ